MISPFAKVYQTLPKLAAFLGSAGYGKAQNLQYC
jgi:hypothetical protein